MGSPSRALRERGFGSAPGSELALLQMQQSIDRMQRDFQQVLEGQVALLNQLNLQRQQTSVIGRQGKESSVKIEGLAGELRSLRTWVTADVLSKLQA